MSRYLTPSKTCLLALVQVYLEGCVPSKAAVSILSFLVTNIFPSKSVPPAPLLLETFEKTLSPQQSSRPGRSVWDKLLEKIWSLDCADKLHGFFDDLEQLIKKPKRPDDDDGYDEEEQYQGIRVTRTSPLGLFVRRAHVEFIRLNFDDTIRLWKSFVVYREPSFPFWSKRSGAAGPQSTIDANLLEMADMRIQDIAYGDLPDPAVPEARYSTEDVDRLIDYYVADITKTGGRLPDEIRTKLTDLASSSNITVPSASHYVSYLDAWKADDYPLALDSLHRYFDYTIQTRDKSHYQYALLNLALLHAHFGAYDEAIAAMQETVATARENKDTACLNYSLSWLYHFGVAHPQSSREIQQSGVLGRGKEALAFLQSKARESGSWELLSSSLAADARLTMLQGDGLTSAVENLVRASHLNLIKRLPRAVGTTMSIEAVLWSRLGTAPLAAARDEIFLECYSDGAEYVDVVNATCRRAAALAARGRYGDALALMDAVPPKALRTPTAHDAWSTALGMLRMQQAIRRRDFFAAQSYLSQLRAITGGGGGEHNDSSPDGGGDGGGGGGGGDNSDTDAAFNVTHLELLALMARGELAAAMERIDTTSRALDAARADIYHRVRLMLLKARLWAAAGQAPRGFSVAMRAAALAFGARLVAPLLCEAAVLLGGILAELGELEAARELLEAVLPHALAAEDCELSARASEALAECHVGLAGKAGTGIDTGASPESSQGGGGGEGSVDGGDDADKRSPKRARTSGGSRKAESPQDASKRSVTHDAAAAAAAVGGHSHGPSPSSTTAKRKEEITRALSLLAAAFDAWSAVGDVAGQARTLAKRATLLQIGGDGQLAGDAAAQYLAVVGRAVEEVR